MGPVARKDTGSLPTPDPASIEALQKEAWQLYRELRELQNRRLDAIRAGGSPRTLKSEIDHTTAKRLSAVALIGAIEGYRDNPSRSSQIRYAKTLERYNKAR